MNQILGQTLQTATGRQCFVEKLLGQGGQGEVYLVKVEGASFALKWYYPNTATPLQRSLIEDTVRRGSPTDKFLWPLEMVSAPDNNTFGYLMRLREERFNNMIDLMAGRVNPSFRSRCRTGYELGDSYFQLHAKGLCYRDINFGNVFFDPNTGEVLICDNDNVGVTGATTADVLGTPGFMAPEIVRSEADPSTDTDLFSLSVMLFYLFMLNHPLEGKKEFDIHCLDPVARNKLYGFEPVFIYDPSDESNRPVPGYHDSVILYWSLYPQFLRDLFLRAFTDGLFDAKHGRVRESEWRKAFVQLRDSLIYCGRCGKESFYDAEKVRVNHPHLCWNPKCNATLQLPPRLRVGKSVVMLNHDTKLFPHHLGDDYNFTAPVAEVAQHPQNPNLWGLRNVSQQNWSVTRSDGVIPEVPPGKSATIALGAKINFGPVEGEIRI